MAKAMFDLTQLQHANLADLAQLVPAAVVSRPLIDTPTFKQILFAMDAHQAISEHRAPFPATVHMLAGKLHFRVQGTDYELGPNDWILLPPNEPHDLRTDEPARFLLTLIKDANP